MKAVILAMVMGIALAHRLDNQVYKMEAGPRPEEDLDFRMLNEMEQQVKQEEGLQHNNQDAKGCCIPRRFSAGMVEGVITKSGKRHQVVGIFANVSYDYSAGKLALHELVFTKKTKRPVPVTAVIDYKKGIMYEYIPAMKHCYKIKIPAYIGSAYVGMTPARLGLSFFAAAKKPQKVDIAAAVSVTSRNCVPVHERIFARVHQGYHRTTDVGVSLGFVNMVSSVPSRAFEPPKACKSVALQTNSFLENNPLFTSMKSLMSSIFTEETQ